MPSRQTGSQGTPGPSSKGSSLVETRCKPQASICKSPRVHKPWYVAAVVSFTLERQETPAALMSSWKQDECLHFPEWDQNLESCLRHTHLHMVGQRTLLLSACLSSEMNGKTQLQSSEAAASFQVTSSASLLPG